MPTSSLAAPARGAQLSTLDGRTLPLRSTRFEVDCRAGLARVDLRQVFVNPHAEPLGVTYTLPLPVDGAVTGFRFAVGDRELIGRVRAREDARARFEEAILEGRTAALLDQERPNLFTQEIGNIPPGACVELTITVDQRLGWLAEEDRGSWEWRFPTVVGPRYLGPPGTVPDAGRVATLHTQESLAVDVGLTLAIRDALVSEPASSSHALAVEPAARGCRVRLAGDKATLDRDIVVRWDVARPEVGIELDLARPDAEHPRSDDAFGLLSVTPPARVAGEDFVPRDLIVVLDTSGSMDGAPLLAAKRIIGQLIDTLSERDRLEMLEFSTTARRWRDRPVAGTAANRQQAQHWLSVLRAGGGTDMTQGILTALGGLRPEAQRQVVVVSDGYIGFEQEVVRAVLERLPRGSRLHTVGVGSSVNRSLTQHAARAGRGVEILLGLDDAIEPASARLRAALDQPVVVDLEVDGSALLDVAPLRTGDLYAGSPARLALRLRPEGGSLRVFGRTNAGGWERRLDVPAVDSGQGTRAIPALWGRETVTDLEMRRAAGEASAGLDRLVVKHGLDFQISTRLTSWIAETRARTVDPSSPRRSEQIVHAVPHGASVTGLGLRPARGQRVVRSEDGVIVGTKGKGPKILGFIPLAGKDGRSRGRSVVVTEAKRDEPAGRASQRKRREDRSLLRRRSRGRLRKSKDQPSGAGTAEMSEKKKHLRIDGTIRISDLAHRMGQPAAQVLRKLWSMGQRGRTLNDTIDFETAELIASEFGYTAQNVEFREDEVIERPTEQGEPRPPVVVVMGHVDHGKTSLLDRVRGTSVAAGEAGGITQHIGAQRVSTAQGDVVFLDTPGHEAFGAMRKRGAGVTDIALLVVAADDGVMPTTIEAIEHAREAGVALVVAINKVDKPEANPGRVEQMLMEHSIVGEKFGGDVPIVEISAKTGQGVDALLEVLALQAELLELRAPTDGPARGVVLEARIDKGRGVITTVLVQAGSLRRGDVMVVGELSGKVRGLLGPGRKTVKVAGPSTPIEVLGLSSIPAVGEPFAVVESEREARTLVAHRREQRMRNPAGSRVPSIAEQLARGQRPTLRLLVKSDVQGSAQALATALGELGDDEVDVEVVGAEVGQITEADVKLAQASDAMIVGFNVKAGGRASSTADTQGVAIRTFGVIYEAIDSVTEAVLDLHEPEYRQLERGEAEVRALFPIPKAGVVAGCRVTRGLIGRHCHVRVVRDGEVVHDGTIASLRVFNDDVREVKDGHECGIVVDGFGELREGDRLQAYDVETVRPTHRG